MAFFDFPDSPILNQEVVGTDGIIYVWDGIKWISGAAPLVYLPIAGGTLTGPLILAGDPTLDLGAATKQYVDDAITAGATEPAGAVGHVQFNAGGTPPVFGGSANLFWDSANNRL